MSGDAPFRVGVAGCGVIAKPYVVDSAAFTTWRPVACADLDPVLTGAFASEHGLRGVTVDDLVADPEVDLVLNLTPPNAHATVTRAALRAGKHVYTEKPLATTAEEGRELVAEAERLGLRIGCAPDTFLGGAYQAAKALIDEGAIGEPLGAVARMLVGGPDAWHPNAAAFYRPGGGPLLDIAPYYLTAIVVLLGPIESIAGFTTTPSKTRTAGTGPHAGETFPVEVPTHAAAVMRMQGGPLAMLTVSFEAREQYVTGMEVFGTDASLVLPDANAFGGDLLLRRGKADVETVPYESRGDQETRGIGLDDLAESIRAGRPHRASGDLGLQVLAAAEAISRSDAERSTVALA